MMNSEIIVDNIQRQINRLNNIVIMIEDDLAFEVTVDVIEALRVIQEQVVEISKVTDLISGQRLRMV